MRRVAIDARRLAGNRRGTAQYIQHLVRWLPVVAPDIDFLLMADRQLPVDRVPAGCRSIVFGENSLSDSQSVSSMAEKSRSVFWMNVLVPFVLRRERVDVFHGPNIAVPPFACCPSVSTVADLVSERIPGTYTPLYHLYRKLLVPSAVRRAVHVIAISESTRRDVIELLHVPADKVSTILLGVDESFMPVADAGLLDRIRTQYRLPTRFVIHVGAIERQKRIETLVRATAELVGKGLLDGLVLVGEDGLGSGDVRAAVTRCDLAGRVTFLGYVPQEHLAPLYTLAACAAYPSWYEGFGLPVLEAMACGTPVVASDASSLPEVGGDAAVLVPPGDITALTSAIEVLLTDVDQRSERVERGFTRARTFSWKQCAARHVDVYRRLLSYNRVDRV
jgi:glycosyltransferase involved in cell wall biosynthesis